jgi:hypothetical protein
MAVGVLPAKRSEGWPFDNSAVIGGGSGGVLNHATLCSAVWHVRARA